jgi:hypothetical protein
MSPRQPWEDALSIAQAERSHARLQWIDSLASALILFLAVIMPHRRHVIRKAGKRLRVRITATNIGYVNTLNNADLALINRVSAMLLNEQLSRELGDEAIKKLLERNG